MRQRGGLGNVVARDSVLTLPITPNVQSMFGGNANVGGYVQSEIAAVRHANGRDMWLIVKNDQQQYLSFLLDQHGVHAQPVLTPNLLGRVFRGVSRALLKASTDGRTLVYSNFLLLFAPGGPTTKRLFYNEVARFDARSGRVTSSFVLPDSVSRRAPAGNVFGVGGLEFSPDGTKLYCDTLRGQEIWQYDLAAGTPAAVAASRTTVAAGPSLSNLGGSAGNLQLGPDGRIYQVGSRSKWLSRFEKPNAKGLNSAFKDSVLEFLDRTYVYNGLPKAPNDLGMSSVTATGAGSVSVGPQCVGEPVQFTSSLSPFVSGAVYSWNFGDLASGALNTGIGQAPVHTYQQSGAYTVTLNISGANGQQYSTFQVVYIQPAPTVSFGAPLYLICPGQSVALVPSAQPSGISYRWQDGSRQPTLQARQPGTYMVSITNANGCTAQASARVDFLPAPKAFLGKDTTICLEQPYLLRVRSSQPAGTSYRWQDGSTGVSQLVQAPGQYAVELTAPSGCVDRASITIRNGNCSVVLPNIITPNGDPSNEFFVVKNLEAAEWSLTVFNRWGRQVFQQTRYDNSWNASGQPAGVYYYQLRNPATGQQYKGLVEVVR
ncbi:T9SS type B sorting domain-containing protein [Hymenobacter ruber]